ncbi:MAG TPA: diguanylate cyclase [Gemmatimonadaceae bacterium]|nr:diguanylate cyclase [Gemmatimonadaceae bacterium]
MHSSVAEPKRILLADQDAVYAGTVAWFLGEHGYGVSRADGTQLFDQLDACAPDLLIMDVCLPGVDGHELIGRVRADVRWRDLPILVASRPTAADAMTRALTSGATDYLPKPFRVADLLSRVRVQFRLRQELLRARAELESTAAELQRVREEAESRRKLADILHEVAGDYAAEELYHILVRRVAMALGISRCSLILAHAGAETGLVAATYESPAEPRLEISLQRYPEITAALERGEPVLVEDVSSSPLYAAAREEWAAAGQTVAVRSSIVLPFALDYQTGGVFFLRTAKGEAPLTRDDMTFASAVVRTAVTAIRRARAIETTLADKARLEQLARTDPLTQTLNRRALMDRITSELERAHRYALLLSILLVDLDHFKEVNDTYGHLAGDEVLRTVAATLQREARTVDVVARYGGEEFVVILPETGEEGAMAVAERIRQRMAEQTPDAEGPGSAVRVTVSIGVATAPLAGVDSPEDLIAAADRALYRAKAEGRNRVCRVGCASPRMEDDSVAR